MKIEVIIPCYHRREKLLRCLDSLFKITTHRFNVFVDYDNLDIEVERRYIDSFFNERMPYADADIILTATDDITFYPDTIEKAVDCFNKNFKNTDGIVELNQENVPGGGCGIIFVGRGFYEKFPKNVFACPDYKHFYKDLEMVTYAKSINRYIRCMDSKVIHYNPKYCSEPADKTFTTLRENIKQRDIDTWQKRQSLGYLWGRDFNLINV